MGRMELREAIFRTVSYLTQYGLSDHAKSLILYYFNQSKGSSAFERALDAISKYYGEDLPGEKDMPERLKQLLITLKQESDEWDME